MGTNVFSNQKYIECGSTQLSSWSRKLKTTITLFLIYAIEKNVSIQDTLPLRTYSTINQEQLALDQTNATIFPNVWNRETVIRK